MMWKAGRFGSRILATSNCAILYTPSCPTALFCIPHPSILYTPPVDFVYPISISDKWNMDKLKEK